MNKCSCTKLSVKSEQKYPAYVRLEKKGSCVLRTFMALFRMWSDTWEEEEEAPAAMRRKKDPYISTSSLWIRRGGEGCNLVCIKRRGV